MRFWCFLTGVVAMAGMLAASPAAASAPKGSGMEDLRRVASMLADCVVRVNAPLVRGVVLQNLSPAQISKSPTARRLIDGLCLQGNRSDDAIAPQIPLGMRFEGDLFRYNLADALIRKDYPTSHHFDFAAVAALQHHDPGVLAPALASGTSRKAKKAREAYEKDLAIVMFSRFGECVCRRNPGDVHKLLLTPVVTPMENVAFAELSSTLGECLADGQLRLSREVVRGVLALNFYRLAGAPADAEVTTLKDGPNA